MLSCVGFRGGTVTAHRKLSWSTVEFLSFFYTVVTAPDVFEPFERSVVSPRVNNRYTDAGLSLSGHLLRAVFIFHLESRELA